MDVAHQVPLYMQFSRQEYWSGLPFPTSGDLPNPGTEPVSLASPPLQVDPLPLSHKGSFRPCICRRRNAFYLCVCVSVCVCVCVFPDSVKECSPFLLIVCSAAKTSPAFNP